MQNETIEKYKAKVESINRERVKLQRMLKEQGKKSQEEIKRQKREMIALQRQQQKAAAERSKLDMKQAAERKCQQRKLEQALAAKDRLEMLLKRKTENSKSAAKQQSVSSKSKMDSTNNNMSVYSKVKVSLKVVITHLIKLYDYNAVNISSMIMILVRNNLFLRGRLC